MMQEKEPWIQSHVLDTIYQPCDWGKLSEPQFPHLQNKDNDASFTVWLWELDFFKYMYLSPFGLR